MKRGLLIGTLLLLAGTLGCNDAPPEGVCAAADGDAGPVTAMGIAFGAEAPTLADGGLSVPLYVSATVPCLVGGATVDVVSSTGALDGLRAGVVDTLALVPVGDVLQGPMTLVVAPGDTARISASLDTASFVAFVATTLDGGVALTGASFTP